MRIIKHNSIVVSEKVLRFVRLFAKPEKCVDVFCRLYSNCREQGFHLTTFSAGKGRAVSFAENRNSDYIVVYRGHDGDFDLAGVPSELVYRNSAEYFANDKDAANYIVDWLLGEQSIK